MPVLFFCSARFRGCPGKARVSPKVFFASAIQNPLVLQTLLKMRAQHLGLGRVFRDLVTRKGPKSPKFHQFFVRRILQNPELQNRT